MNLTAQLFMDSLIYVMNQNLFWGSMGFTTAMAIFIGVLLYDGNTKEAQKGTVAVLSYVGMILWTTSLRIFPIVFDQKYSYEYLSQGGRYGMVFAGVATILYLTIFWLLGIFIGVNIFKWKRYTLI